MIHTYQVGDVVAVAPAAGGSRAAGEVDAGDVGPWQVVVVPDVQERVPEHVQRRHRGRKANVSSAGGHQLDGYRHRNKLQYCNDDDTNTAVHGYGLDLVVAPRSWEFRQ